MDCQAKIRSSDILSSGSDDTVEDKDVVPKIKLKLSNGGGPSSRLNPMARVCDYCGKEFSNGKALGGHIRIHTQALRKQGMLKLQSSGSRYEENNNLDIDDKQVCPICNRVLPSVKALLGHMRFHNERSSLSSSSSSSSSSDEEENVEKPKKIMSIDLLKDLPNWSRTDKRGRGSTCEAALNLISLASAGRISETLPEYTLTKKKNKHEDIIDRKGKSLVLMSSSSSSSKDNNGPPPGRRRRRIRFMCSTCGRVFPTFQALGGHRSSHNKDKTLVGSRDSNINNLIISRQNKTYHRTQSVSASTELALITATAAAGVGPHRCDICRKNFPSGQALGGHKRCHWGAKNDELDNPDDEVSPDPAGFRQQDPMDIDLNKLPLMEDVHQDNK